MYLANRSILEIRALAAALIQRGDRGEGVISTAIVVLITAFIGAAMWVAFTTIWGNAENDITNQVNSIGN